MTYQMMRLVFRCEGMGTRRSAHRGTGNYNSDTARTYEDLGLLTADQQLGNDVADLFNLLTGYSRQRGYGRLLVAPIALRSRIIEMIRQQMALGEQGRITLKLNSLVDPQTIDALYEASSAGVRIDLAVRGICCLRPKVPGLSETIRVRSVVGRFLEHSRIYRFGDPAREARYYISSADLMPRNLDRRVDAARCGDPSRDGRPGGDPRRARGGQAVPLARRLPFLRARRRRDRDSRRAARHVRASARCGPRPRRLPGGPRGGERERAGGDPRGGRADRLDGRRRTGDRARQAPALHGFAGACAAADDVDVDRGGSSAATTGAGSRSFRGDVLGLEGARTTGRSSQPFLTGSRPARPADPRQAGALRGR